MPKPSFIRQEGDSLYFNGPGEFIFFVPEKYFERGEKKLALIDGEFIELLGILNYAVRKNKDDNDFSKKLKTFKFASRFVTKPGRVEKVKNLSLSDHSKPEDYRLLIYTDNKSDQIVVSTKVPEEILNVEDFIRLFVLTGGIPKTIPYDILHEYFLNTMALNGSSYKTTAQLFGIVISELCRDPKDVNKPFRLSKNDDMYAYDPISIKKVPKLNGPYNSLTSENWDESLMGAIMNPDSKGSPLERVLMGNK